MKEEFISIYETIKQSPETMAEFSDKAIDLVDSSEVLNDVPIIGTAIKCLQIKDKYQEYKLKTNCKAFLLALGSNEEEKINDFHEEVNSGKIDEDDFIDTVFWFLLESEKPFKAEVFFGRLLRCRILGWIEHEKFKELALLVMSAPIPALKALDSFFLQYKKHNSTKGNESKKFEKEPFLISLGVAYRENDILFINDFGRDLYLFGFAGEEVIEDTTGTIYCAIMNS